MGDDGSFFAGDWSGFLCITQAAGVPWLQMSRGFHVVCVVPISARTQLQ